MSDKMELSHNHERNHHLMSIENRIISCSELKDVHFTHFESTPHENVLSFEIPRKPHCCPQCDVMTETVHDYRTQRVLDLPLYGKKTFLLYRKRWYRCPNCGKRFFESNTFLPRYATTSIDSFLNSSKSFIRCRLKKTLRNTMPLHLRE